MRLNDKATRFILVLSFVLFLIEIIVFMEVQ